MKTIWNIISTENEKMVKNENKYQSNITENTTYDCQVIADSFNKHFLTLWRRIFF
jgi:hypothetical protein